MRHARSLLILLLAAPATTQATLLRDIAPGTKGSTPRACVEFDGKSFFVASPAGNGVSWYLFRTDGTAGGTAQFGGNPVGRELGRAGQRLFYSAQTPAAGMELWSSDGVGPGAMVADLYPGATGAQPSGFVPLGDRLAFFATLAAGLRLCVSDGTAAGTLDLAGASSQSAAAISGWLFFAGADGELWKTDGTPAGTALVKDIRTGPGASSPSQLLAYQGRIWFLADDGFSGAELWYSDGTPLGTALFLDITPGNGGSAIRGLTIAGGQMFFAIGTRLYVTSGFVGGTKEVVANPPFFLANASGLRPLIALGTSVYFAGNNPSWGTELWRSDGTAPGTWMVKDIWPGSTSGLGGSDLWQLGSRRLFFRAQSPVTGLEVWCSDGTTNGTLVSLDFVPGSGGGPFGSDPLQASLVRGRLVFDAWDATYGVEPFAYWPGATAQAIGWSCGTTQPTVRRSQLAASDPVLGGVIQFEGSDAPGGALGSIFLGFPAPSPIPLGGECRSWIDLNAYIALPPFWNTAGAWQSNLAIPLDPAFQGVSLVAQCFYVGSNAPLGYEASNGVMLGFGY